MGVYSYTGRCIPLGGIQDNAPAWATAMPVVMFLLKNSSSMDISSGPEPVDERLHILGDLHQTAASGWPGRRGNGPVLDHLLPAPLGFDDAEAHRGHTGSMPNMRIAAPPPCNHLIITNVRVKSNTAQ